MVEAELIYSSIYIPDPPAHHSTELCKGANAAQHVRDILVLQINVTSFTKVAGLACLVLSLSPEL